MAFSSSCQRKKNVANAAANSCTATNAATLAGLMPANVSEKLRAMVTAGLANDVEDAGVFVNELAGTLLHLRVVVDEEFCEYLFR